MATPHAAGVAALIVSEFGSVGDDGDIELEPNDVERRLTKSATRIGLKAFYGAGLVDAYGAVAY